MMTLYDINAQHGNATLVNVDEMAQWSDFSQFHFKGKPQNNWMSVKFEWHSKDDKYRNPNDFIFVHNGIGLGIVLNEKAKNVLEPVLKDDAEYLPVEVVGDTHSYYLLNIINIVKDALNLEQCQFHTLRSGAFGEITKTVFAENNIPENRAFVYPQSIKLPLFKGELLKNIYEEHQLTGLDFIPVGAS